MGRAPLGGASSPRCYAIWDSLFGKKPADPSQPEVVEDAEEVVDDADMPSAQADEAFLGDEDAHRPSEHGLPPQDEASDDAQDEPQQHVSNVAMLSPDDLEKLKDRHRWAPILTIPVERFGTYEADADVTITEMAEKPFAFLDPNLFLTPIRTDIIHRCVTWQLAARRTGTATVKGRGDVRGSTRKLYRQKGTGRARVGNNRAAHRVGGGKAHAKVQRSFFFPLQLKVRKLGVSCALALKYATGKLRVVENTMVDTPKTKALAEELESRGWNDVLVIDGYHSERDWPKKKPPPVKRSKRPTTPKPKPTNFTMAARNLHWVKLLKVKETNVYDILRHDTLVLTLDALSYLSNRLVPNDEPLPYEPTHTWNYRSQVLGISSPAQDSSSV